MKAHKENINKGRKAHQFNLNEFLKEVKKIFPNATLESIQLSKRLMKIDFCWCYGLISVKNYPEEYHKQINKINKMARLIK